MNDPVFELAERMHKGEIKTAHIGVDDALKVRNYLSKRGHNVKLVGIALVYVTDETFDKLKHIPEK